MGQSTSSAPLSDPQAFATPAGDSTNPQWWKTYDYVIVGGGTAGCVLASRLSEDPNVSVLLIEAGTKRGSNVFFSNIPLAYTKLCKGPYDWNYETSPQAALNGRKCYWPRGKLLGGCSSTNALNYHRCSPEDFKSWVDHGATDWSHENLKPYFNKAERYRSDPLHAQVDSGVHGKNGPIVSGHFKAAPIMDTIIESCVNSGMNRVFDFNTDAGTLGVSHIMAAIDEKGTRSSTETGYMTSKVLARNNLKVALGTMVEKIIFSSGDSKPRAIGVQLSISPDSPKFYVAAKKEVLLTAGAIGSPHLLLLSGVGPAKHLAEAGVELVQDLPLVGQTLQDHISSGAVVFRSKPGITLDHLTKPLSSYMALAQWVLLGTGPMSGKSTQIAAFVRSDNPNLPKDILNGPEVQDKTSGPNSPDLELMYAPMIGVVDRPGTAAMNGITALSILLKPTSVGSLTLVSSNPYDYPTLNPNYFAEQNDVKVVLRGLRLLLHIARTKPFSDYLDLGHDAKDPSSIFWPGDCEPDQVSDDELFEWVKKKAQTPWHPVASAKMGSSPADSVVDPELRVHGVDGLRVIDASVFPTQVSGHCCAVVIAVAERASDIIKGKL